jgi:3-oxoacyl-[acyl-carrier protein] reductase
MIEDLVGKVVLVTGSSTGIGAAVARGFAANGAKVAVHCHASKAAAERVLADIEKGGGEAAVFAADVTKSTEVERLVAAAAARFGRLDVLVNNAGGLLKRAPLAELDDALYDQVLDLNVRSVVGACRAAVPHMRRNGGGPGAALYAGAKGFVETLTRNLAKEFATQGIRVNAVAPGVIMTPFHERFSTPEMLEGFRKTIPMGRLGTPEECVGAYLFLASARLSGYVTGQVIEVNGGQLMP